MPVFDACTQRAAIEEHNALTSSDVIEFALTLAPLRITPATTLPDSQKRHLTGIADSITATLVTLVHWILWTAPVGVFALAAPLAADTGLALLRSLGVFVGAVITGLVIFTGLVYLPLVRAVARLPVGRFLGASLEPATIAFTPTSSVASLPAMFHAAERLGLARPIASFVLPVGAAMAAGSRGSA